MTPPDCTPFGNGFNCVKDFDNPDPLRSGSPLWGVSGHLAQRFAPKRVITVLQPSGSRLRERPEPKIFCALILNNREIAVPGPSKRSFNTGETAAPTFPCATKHCMSFHVRPESIPGKHHLPYDAAAPEFVVLQIHGPRSALIWSCCHCPAEEDVTAPLPHLSCQLLRAHSIQYSSDILYFRCLPFQGCRDPLLSVSVDSDKLQQVNLP
jgi:hypothetical protein